MYYGNKMKRKIIIAISFVLLFVTGFQTPQEEATPQKELVESTTDMPRLITAKIGDLQKAEYYDGEINPVMKVLQFPRKGVFQEYKVMLGDSVKKGQVLAVTKPQYEQEIEDLTEHLENLRREYDNNLKNYQLRLFTNEWQVVRMRNIIESMSADMPRFDDICITFELTMAEGRKIEVERDQYKERSEKEIAFQEEKLARLIAKNETNIITAPQDGIITYLAELKVGDAVGVNSYPIVLADTKDCLVQCEYISVLDMEDVKSVYGVKDGKQYEMVYHPYENGEYERKVAKGEGVYSLFEVVSPDESIRFGEDIKVITVTESKENVLIIPTDCIRNDSGEDYVYCDVNGEKKAVPIEIGMSDEINTEILSGLAEGDIIYASN